MSEMHLAELRRALERHNWIVADELEGNGYDISGVWVIKRPDGSGVFHVEFQGLGDIDVLPMDKAYACHLRENHGISAYFARRTRSWPVELDAFIHALDQWST